MIGSRLNIIFRKSRIYPFFLPRRLVANKVAAGVLQAVTSPLLPLFNCTLVIVLLFPNTQFVPPDSMVLLHDV